MTKASQSCTNNKDKQHQQINSTTINNGGTTEVQRKYLARKRRPMNSDKRASTTLEAHGRPRILCSTATGLWVQPCLLESIENQRCRRHVAPIFATLVLFPFPRRLSFLPQCGRFPSRLLYSVNTNNTGTNKYKCWLRNFVWLLLQLTDCNILQQTATDCNRLQQTAHGVLTSFQQHGFTIVHGTTQSFKMCVLPFDQFNHSFHDDFIEFSIDFCCLPSYLCLQQF